jgi:serine/threonine-protein kinase
MIPDELAKALGDRYRLEKEIGRGGMAVVYLATDLKHDRPVAIKALHPEIAAGEARERFLREIAIVAQLSHPHVLPLIDSGVAADRLYYVVPFVAGESLREKLQHERQLGVDDALRLTREIASGLDHAHARGLIHRDIKPENVLLAEGHAQIADFGIARGKDRDDDDNKTTMGTVLGTPAYMSPEQATGGVELDARSDVYSLACVTYEMLAGEPPFTGPAGSVMYQQVSVPPRPITERRPGIRREIGEALRVALSKSRTDRFPSASAFAQALVTPGPALHRAPSVAVLPFANLSADPENEFFADGITEDVIAQLAKVRTLKVISRASVMPFKKRDLTLKEIAERLDVVNVLEGSVRRAGDRVRVVVQLVEAETERTLWAETYDRRMTDIFEIQSDIALSIAESLKTQLTHEERSRIDKEPTNNLQAYQHYLRGRQLLITWEPVQMHRAIEQFQRAVELDPKYALPHAGIAQAWTEMVDIGAEQSAEAGRKAKAAAARALEADPESAEAHTSSGIAKLIFDYDWEGAEKAFRRAIELRPGFADAYDLYGRMCAAVGRFDEAVALQERAFELDPISHKTDVSTALLRAGRNAEAEVAARRSLGLDPDYPRAIATLGWAQFRQGQHEEGIATLRRAADLSPTEWIWRAQLGQALGFAGHHDEAREILGQLEAKHASPYHRGYVLVGLGEIDRALDLLEEAVAVHSGSTYGIKGSFLWEPLRGHPRFQALLRGMKLE